MNWSGCSLYKDYSDSREYKQALDTYLNQGKSPLDSPGFDERFAAFLTDEEKQNELMIEAVPSFADFVAREYPPIAAQRDRVKKAHERREKSKPKN